MTLSGSHLLFLVALGKAAGRFEDWQRPWGQAHCVEELAPAFKWDAEGTEGPRRCDCDRGWGTAGTQRQGRRGGGPAGGGQTTPFVAPKGCVVPAGPGLVLAGTLGRSSRGSGRLRGPSDRWVTPAGVRGNHDCRVSADGVGGTELFQPSGNALQLWVCYFSTCTQFQDSHRAAPSRSPARHGPENPRGAPPGGGARVPRSLRPVSGLGTEDRRRAGFLDRWTCWELEPGQTSRTPCHPPPEPLLQPRS